jgi:hypothetical protein
MGKLVRLSDEEVDRIEKRLAVSIKNNKFNDHHIIAIVTVSKLKLICSKDKEAMAEFKNKANYPPKFDLPKVYCNKKSAGNLLTSKYIVKICS